MLGRWVVRPINPATQPIILKIVGFLHKQGALCPTETRLFRVLWIYNFGSGLTEAEEWDSKPAAALALQTPTFLIRYSLLSVCIVPTSFSQSLELKNKVWNLKWGKETKGSNSNCSQGMR